MISNLHLGNVTVNQVNIIESQVFVYNLGTMYYLDDLFYPEILESLKRYDDPTTIPSNKSTTTQLSDVNLPDDTDDRQPDVRSDDDNGQLNDNDDDDGDGEVVTPRALPVQLLMD